MSVFYHRACRTRLLAAIVLTVGCLATLLSGNELEQLLANIDGETTVVLRFDAAALEAFVDDEKKGAKDREKTVLEYNIEKTREILDGDPIWLTIGFPLPPVQVQILVRDPDGDRIEKLKDLWEVPESDTNDLVRWEIRSLAEPDAGENSVDPVDAVRTEQWKSLLPAGAKNRQGKIQFGFLPPPHLYDTYRELIVELPDYLGGGPVTILTEGLQQISGTFDLKTGVLESTIDSATPEDATAFAERASELLVSLTGKKLLSDLADGSGLNPKTNQAAQLVLHLGLSTFNADKNQVRWQIAENNFWKPKRIFRLLVGSSANYSLDDCMRNLALGIHNYESAMGHFPPPIKPEGEPSGLSWRVHILPFLGENELYDQFEIDEPWDSPTNIKLLPQIPDLYSKYDRKLFSPVSAKQGYTTIVAPISENTVLGSPKQVKFRAIKDGSSNTILMVNVKESLAVPWTAPKDYEFDREQPGAGLQFTDGRAVVVFCDARAHSLREENDWLSLFEMNDGIVLEPK